MKKYIDKTDKRRCHDWYRYDNTIKKWIKDSQHQFPPKQVNIKIMNMLLNVRTKKNIILLLKKEIIKIIIKKSW